MAKEYSETLVIPAKRLVKKLDCSVSPVSSRMCEHGTKGCNIRHRECLIKTVCRQLVGEHEGMRKFTAGLNAKNVKPCKCNGCVAARKLYSDKELGVK